MGTLILGPVREGALTPNVVSQGLGVDSTGTVAKLTTPSWLNPAKVLGAQAIQVWYGMCMVDCQAGSFFH